MHTCMIFLTQTTNYISPVLGGGGRRHSGQSDGQADGDS
jgi:hypothetical protein